MLGDEGGNFRWGSRKEAVFAYVVAGVGEPYDVATGVQDERDGLRRSAEWKGNEVTAIAVRRQLSCNVRLLVFEVKSSG